MFIVVVKGSRKECRAPSYLAEQPEEGWGVIWDDCVSKALLFETRELAEAACLVARDGVVRGVRV